MPIIVDNFSWTQNDDMVIVKVPLRNRRPHEVDVFTSSKYIKVHFPPYLFEAALLHDIDEDRSKCVLRDDDASFELAKTSSITWTSLTKELTKQELIRLKEEAISDVHKKEEKLDSDRKNQVGTPSPLTSQDFKTNLNALNSVQSLLFDSTYCQKSKIKTLG